MTTEQLERHQERRRRRFQKKRDRWSEACRLAGWTDPDVEPAPSAWGRWTPPKKWREFHAEIMRFTRDQIRFIASLMPDVGEGGIVTIQRMSGPSRFVDPNELNPGGAE